MSAYTYVERDTIICPRPCLLYSVNIYNVGSDKGKVRIYDGKDASSGRLIATLTCPAESSQLHRFHGIECKRGLYLDIVEKAEEATVEWEPMAKPE